MNDPVSIITSLTTAAKNVKDISTDLINTRKQNRIISAAQLRRMKNAIEEALERDRTENYLKGHHYLHKLSYAMLLDSYREYEPYANTVIGDLLLREIHQEALRLDEQISFYDRRSRMGDM